MTTNQPALRSAELLVLDAEYQKLLDARTRGTDEPENDGTPVDNFLALSSNVAEKYQPSGYLSNAPIRK